MTPEEQRRYWLDTMLKIADPVLLALSQNKLKKTMPVECGYGDRTSSAHLEAFGRTMCGFSAWLEAENISDDEKALQEKYKKIVFACIDNATDPDSPDFLNYCSGLQPLVDTAFLAHAVLRAPKSIASALNDRLRNNLLCAFRSSRKIIPAPCNWLLFSAMVEAGIYVLGGRDYDLLRVKYALRQHMQWYKGDGFYGDGAVFHADYYNSFVIIPMLVDICSVFSDIDGEISELYEIVVKRAARYAALQERMISPEGTYPIIGRSVTYRFGAFQALAQGAQEKYIYDSCDIKPAQIRCALTEVIKRIMASGIFDDNGWLRIGLYGYQPGLGEEYICTGSLYLCSTVFLPLALSSDDPFWSGEDLKWTSKKIANGEDMPSDHSISI